MKDLTCQDVHDQDLIVCYLTGEMSEPEAERLEKHFIGCVSCAAELERGAELRLAHGSRLFGLKKLSGLSMMDNLWTLAAAAAAVAALAVGIASLSAEARRVSTPDAVRASAGSPFSFDARGLSGGEILVSWSRIDDAAIYRIEVIRSDGEPVLTSETTNTRVEIKAGALPPLPAGVSLLIRVRALNALGQSVAEPAFQRLVAE
ncbi:MAG TPA: zf-HC2 domain-containing protein [Thermoanaerobaculia bacterium]|nr:zf-HC2 domain-containing protein [Thermoanaerobaculia bacterium]